MLADNHVKFVAVGHGCQIKVDIDVDVRETEFNEILGLFITIDFMSNQ